VVAALGLKNNKKIDQMEIKPEIDTIMILGALGVGVGVSVNIIYK
jgi:hypothetical protein